MSRQKNILIVEDEAIVAMESRLNLISAGFNITAVVSSGIEAVMMCEIELPDLILMDIKLKGEMTGIDAAHRIRRISSLPILFFTGNSDARTREQILSISNCRIIHKPVQTAEILREVDELLTVN
jgi:CheY-like chemotaxis protein